MVTMPVPKGFVATSHYGPRAGGFHYGTDFGKPGGCAGLPVYAVKDGTVIHAGAAQGYGGPDPAGWLVIDHPASVGGGCSEYGHIVREVKVGDYVREGQRIGYINPDSRTNGGVAPHVHFSWMPYEYNPSRKLNPMATVLYNARWVGDVAPVAAPPSAPARKQFKDYLKVEPDEYALLPPQPPRFTRGRAGKIRYITRHHTMGKTDAAGVNRTWRTREASAHYLIDVTGWVSQHVNDRDTAWSNANAASNAVSIAIEHSNDGGPDWSISETTLREGARWAAALCLFYGLGRPQFGVNIRDHNEFTPTECPKHLAKGGKYHDMWMRTAQEFYDELVAGRVTPLAPAPTKEEKVTPEQANRIEQKLDKLLENQNTILSQLGFNNGRWEGFRQGGNRTAYDLQAAIAEKLDIPGTYDQLAVLKAKKEI